jgi:hypothetical protein
MLMSILDRPILVTFFRNSGAMNKGEARYSPLELAERILATTAEHKTELPWLKLARFGNRRTDKGSLRHDGNVLAISGLEADYDGGLITFDEALETLEKQGVASILYTSPGYSESAPRWRVLCPTSVEAKPAQRRHLLGRLNGLFCGTFARESWTLSQSYYFGSVRNNSSHRVELIDGTPIDQHDDLDEIWIGPTNTQTASNRGNVTGDERETAELIRRSLTGEELHTTLTPLAARLIGRNVPRDIVRELLRAIMLSWPEAARDDRWKARFAGIDRQIDSAVAKYAEPAANRRNNKRAIARLTGTMIRNRQHPDIIRTAVAAEADKLSMPHNEAIQVMDWVANREFDRRRAANAPQRRASA